MGFDEIYIENNKLIKEAEWKKEISKLKVKGKSNKEKLKNSIIDSIKQRIPNKKFGIAFSGGVDSSLIALICKKLKANFICYCVGLKNSEDLAYAKKTAKKLKLNLKTKQLNLKEAKKIIKQTAKILSKQKNQNLAVNIGVGSVLYSVIKLAKKDKINLLFSGLGSEEIFAGYQRHKESKNINKECWKGLKNMWKRDLIRDYTISNELKIKLATPFLDREVIKTAMQISVKQKLTKTQNKIILREIARELGLPKEIAQRKKRAAQYGSRFDKAIAKLTKKSGFIFKKDYLKSLI